MSTFLSQHWSEIVTLTLEHLWLTGAAMLFAIAIGVPVGIWLTRNPRWAQWVLGLANIIQTIPSLALFGLLLPLPWLGERAARIAIVALSAYALLPILRNTYAGIRGLEPAVIDVAHALGMTDMQRLFKVELPLAAGFCWRAFEQRRLRVWASRRLRRRWVRADWGSSSFAEWPRWITGWCSPGRFLRRRLPWRRMDCWGWLSDVSRSGTD